jgi:phage virion morphogenesis protein
MDIKVNDGKFQIALSNFTGMITTDRLLRVAGEVMLGSKEKTFREQGSPAGSWPPLAKSTLRRKKKGYKILIESARLKNSVTYKIMGNRLIIGTNLKYAQIQQRGGQAGRKGPFKKKGGRRPMIPARPFVIFRPEDPQRIQAAMEKAIAAAAQKEGLA